MLFWIIALIAAVTVHEFSHAWMADRLGDPTAKLAGRLTLNPLAHLDPLGTLALLIVHFGWGKPVPVDPFNLRNPRRDSAIISLAGPASNLILAVILSLAGRFLPEWPLLYTLWQTIIILNVGLAVFNLLPVGPLDGAKILVGFLPTEVSIKTEEFLNQYGIALLLILLLPLGNQGSLIGYIISPIINLIINFLI